MSWFIDHRPEFHPHLDATRRSADGERRLLSLVPRQRLRRVLARMLDEEEFLSSCGVRALSAHHRDHPYLFACDGITEGVAYQPGESTSGLFGGNSNWRGPIWMPVNYLIIESLQKFQHYYGDDFKVECPTGSGHYHTIGEVAGELATRLTRLFLRNEEGQR